MPAAVIATTGDITTLAATNTATTAADAAPNYTSDDNAKIVKIQATWRGRQQHKAYTVRRDERAREREAKFAAADLFDAAFVIQRLIRRIRAKRAAKAEIAAKAAAANANNGNEGGGGAEMQQQTSVGSVGAGGKKLVPKVTTITRRTVTRTVLGGPKVVGGGGGTNEDGSPLSSKVTTTTTRTVTHGGRVSTASSANAGDGGEGPLAADGSGVQTPKRAAAGSALSYLRTSPASSSSAAAGGGGGGGIGTSFSTTTSSTGGHYAPDRSALGPSYANVPDRCLRLSSAPSDAELLRLFRAMARCDAVGGSGPNAATSSFSSSGGAAGDDGGDDGGDEEDPTGSISEPACLALFRCYGGEATFLSNAASSDSKGGKDSTIGNDAKSHVRSLLERIVRPSRGAAAMPRADEPLVLNFDQFCRFMLRLLR